MPQHQKVQGTFWHKYSATTINRDTR